MPLHAYMASHTETEHEVWLAWLEMEQERPSRTDWYLMQVALECVRPWTKAKLELDQFRLRFAARTQTAQDAAAAAKARWFAATGYKPPEAKS